MVASAVTQTTRAASPGRANLSLGSSMLSSGIATCKVSVRYSRPPPSDPDRRDEPFLGFLLLVDGAVAEELDDAFLRRSPGVPWPHAHRWLHQDEVVHEDVRSVAEGAVDLRLLGPVRAVVLACAVPPRCPGPGAPEETKRQDTRDESETFLDPCLEARLHQSLQGPLGSVSLRRARSPMPSLLPLGRVDD